MREILRLFLLGELDKDPAINEAMARAALMDLVEDPDLVTSWITNAAQIVGPDLSTGAIVGGPGTPIFTGPGSIPVQGEGGDNTPIVNFSGTIADPPDRDEALRVLLGDQTGRQAAFRSFQGSQGNASPLLRTGLESRFSPLNTLFETRGALGDLNQATGVSGIAGLPQTFSDFISNRGGGRPSLGTLQQNAWSARDAIQGLLAQDPGGEFDVGQSHLLDPNNQFNIALQSRLQSVPRFLQAGFRDTADRFFKDFVARNPDTASSFLNNFLEGGSRFGGF